MDVIGKIADRLLSARRVTVLTGAGVSAASGVPTFRGENGLWKSHRPEDLATPEAFAVDPALVWEWYDGRRRMVAACRPNRGHEVLAVWSRRFPEFTLVTQNVDGLHELAGTAHVVRYHGSIWEVRCMAGCRPPWGDRRVPMPEIPPLCDCGALLRPGVVWFGEAIPEDAVLASSRATRCDVFFSVGTSAVVYPAAGLIQAAARQGAITVEINPEPTPLSARVDYSIREASEAALDRLGTLLNRP
jgi:NAD-dependent protein deacetylase/lipoamidase